MIEIESNSIVKRRFIGETFMRQKIMAFLVSFLLLSGGGSAYAQFSGDIAADFDAKKPAATTKLPLPHAQYGLSPEEEEALALEAELEMTAQKERVRRKNFELAIEEMLPLRPEEIQEMLGAFEESRQAAEEPLSVPEPVVLVQTVSLDPGVTPPIIKMSSGHVTTLTILDMTGAPWPVQDVSWAGKFTVTPPEGGGHVIRITPSSAHGVGNMSIRLVDLITPVTLTLRTGADIAYYRFDARIPKMGPLAKVPLIESGGLMAVAGDDVLVGVLDGVPPVDANKLSVKGVDARTTAWKVGGTMYVRTPLTLLSPAWQGSVSSADGMHVYALNEVAILLLSDGGRMVRARIGNGE